MRVRLFWMLLKGKPRLGFARLTSPFGPTVYSLLLWNRRAIYWFERRQ